MAKRLVVSVLLTAFCLFCATALVAQVISTGRLIGTVTDQTGAVIAGAQVKVRDDATGAVIETKTGNDGQFSVANLKPGNYTVSVTMQGFKASEFRAVKIIVGQVYTLEAKMEVGAVESTVVVEAGAEVLETASPVVGTTITGKAITQLPLTSRDALDLAILMPGAATTGRVRQTSFMGLPKGAINITYDGINAQDNINKSSDGFFTTIRPKVDAVEEFSVSTAGAGADSSAEGAVQIKIETKRGGNEYHGGVFWQHRNDFLNSNYWFSNQLGLDRQRIRLNQYGYKVGGPVWKDKIFFFHAFEFYRKPDSIFRTRTILNNLALSGQYRYTVVPAGFATTAATPLQPWMNCGGAFVPGFVGTVPGGTVCTATLLGTPTSLASNLGLQNAVDTQVNTILSAVNSSLTAPSVRVNPAPSLFQESISFNNIADQKRYFPDWRFDWNVTKSHQVFAIYHYSKFKSTPDTLNSRDFTYPVAPFNTNQASQNSDRNAMVFGWRWNLASNKSNEVRFGIVSAPVAFFNDINSSIYPQINTSLGAIRVNPGTFGGFVSSPFLPFGAFPRNTALGQLTDNFSWTKGKHNLSFGASFTRIHGGIQSNSAEVGSVTLGLNGNDPAALAGIASAGNYPGAPTADPGRAGSLYAVLSGRVTAYSASVFVDTKTRQFVTGAPLFEKYRQMEFGFYVNDSWRIHPTLTITAGLRWEYQGSPYGVDNIYYEAVGGQDAVYGISGSETGLFNPTASGGSPATFQLHGNGQWYEKDLNNFVPSIGLAWTPNFDNKIYNLIFGGPSKSVFRASYNMTTTREGTANWLSMVEGNPGYFGSQSASAVATVAAPGQFQAGTLFFNGLNVPNVLQTPTSFGGSFAINPTANQGVNVFRKDLQIPKVHQFTFGIQRELTPNMVLEFRYVGNSGDGLWRQYSVNEVNIFENGFLTEFGNALNNLNICIQPANLVTCRTNSGFTGNPANFAGHFANLGLAGQVPVPILTAAFTGSPNGPQSGGNTSAAANFRSGGFITQLNNGLAGSMASSISGSLTFWNNIVAAGAIDPRFTPNFFTVNPHARGGSFIMTNDSHSSYHSLQVEFRRRLSKGVQMTANYTFSKALSNLFADSGASFSNFSTLRNKNRDKGRSPWDLPHQFKAQGIWELPFGPGKKWSSSHGVVNRIIEGWEISGVNRWQSGRVFRLDSGLGGTVNQFDGGVRYLGITPSQVQDQLEIRKLPTGQVFWFPAALVGSGGIANSTFLRSCNTAGAFCQRNFFSGPIFYRMDLNIVKRTKITERINFEFRAEFLNAFNNINFFFPGAEATSVPTENLQNTSFGRSTAAYRDFSTTDDPGGRIIQFVLRINF